MPAELDASATQLMDLHTLILLRACLAKFLLFPTSLKSGTRSMASEAEAATVPSLWAPRSITSQLMSEAPTEKIKFCGVLPPEYLNPHNSPAALIGLHTNFDLLTRPALSRRNKRCSCSAGSLK